MGELIAAVVDWRNLLLVLLVFGTAPGLVLRFILVAYHRDDPRRIELLAELREVPRHLRPLWVAEQLETALMDGLWPRYQVFEQDVIGHIVLPFKLRRGQKRLKKARIIPCHVAQNTVSPGDVVKVAISLDGNFALLPLQVTRVDGDRLVGGVMFPGTSGASSSCGAA
jgi:hypothetical protein